MMKIKITGISFIVFLQIFSLSAQKQGIYFSKKEYIPTRMIPFSEALDKLPSPIFDEDTAYVSCYWKAWEIALNHLRTVVEVYKITGTIWENYAPDTLSCGKLDNNSSVKDNFVGWSGMAPIRFFIEYAIGLRADAPTNTIEWTITSKKRTGIEKFWFVGNTLDLIAQEAGPDGLRQVRISTEKPFKLTIIMGNKKKELNIPENGTIEIKL